MAGNRANVLRAVHTTLATFEPLRSYLKHQAGAVSLKAGARIIGDDVRIDDLPIPALVLSFAGGDAIEPTRELATWLLDATAYATDVFQAAEILDRVEACATSWTRDSTLTPPLTRFRVTGHERLDAVGPAGRLIAVRVNLEVSWISN